MPTADATLLSLTRITIPVVLSPLAVVALSFIVGDIDPPVLAGGFGVDLPVFFLLFDNIRALLFPQLVPSLEASSAVSTS